MLADGGPGDYEHLNVDGTAVLACKLSADGAGNRQSLRRGYGDRYRVE